MILQGRIRTHDICLQSQAFYPLDLWALTLAASLIIEPWVNEWKVRMLPLGYAAPNTFKMEE